MSAPYEIQLRDSRDPGAVREAATVWALATARRDRRTQPATAEATLPGMQRRLQVTGARLLLARHGTATLGFTLFAPEASCLEIFYLAVTPASWGTGVASRLLAGAEDHARRLERAAVELWVINDNERALAVYARSGFVATERMQHDAVSGRSERRLIKTLR